MTDIKVFENSTLIWANKTKKINTRNIRVTAVKSITVTALCFPTLPCKYLPSWHRLSFVHASFLADPLRQIQIRSSLWYGNINKTERPTGTTEALPLGSSFIPSYCSSPSIDTGYRHNTDNIDMQRNQNRVTAAQTLTYIAIPIKKTKKTQMNNKQSNKHVHIHINIYNKN